MVTPRPIPNTSSPTKRPIGIVVAESYFVTFIALFSFGLITDLDFYTRRAPRLHLHILSFFAVPTRILELIICLSCAFAVVGLQRMRPWGRWLAIVLAGIAVASAIWFYSAVLFFRMWTIVPHQVWPYIKSAVKLGFGIYIVWYLLQSKTRRAFGHAPTVVRPEKVILTPVARVKRVV
jgi:hypothetical protein